MRKKRYIMTEEKIRQEEPMPVPPEKKGKPRVGEIGENGYIVRKKRWGDRNDGRRLRTTPAMLKFMPYIMRDRNDGCNQFEDSIDIAPAEKWLREKRSEGWKGMGMLHLFMAAYVRTVSHCPGINRFVAGQKI